MQVRCKSKTRKQTYTQWLQWKWPENALQHKDNRQSVHLKHTDLKLLAGQMTTLSDFVAVQLKT